jgi:ABC-type branched-subunit amino acid transport system substrate-binding protein
VRRHRIQRWSAVVVGLSLLVAACADDDDESADTDAAATTEASPNTTAGAEDTTATTTGGTVSETTAGTTAETTTETTAATAGEEPTGEPIKFGVAAAVEGVVGQPELFDGIDAAVASVNAAGGIPDPAGGPNRPLEVVRCEAGAGGSVSPDVALECARDTIDAGIIAVVGEYLIGADGTKAWQEAGIPMIGTMPVEAEDFVNPAVWPITGGALAGTPGLGYALQQAGAKTIGFITGDVEAGRALPGLLKPALEEESDLVNETYVSLDPSADYTPQLVQLASANPDAIAVIGSTDINARAIAGLRQAGYTGLIGVPGTGLSPDALADLGEMAEELIVVSSFNAPTDTDNEAIAAFNAGMDEYAPDAIRNEFSLNAWASVNLFAEILATLDAIDAATLSAALDGYQVDLGLTPPFTFGVPNNQLGVPRIFTVAFQPQIVEGGEIVSNGDFVDLAAVIGG